MSEPKKNNSTTDQIGQGVTKSTGFTNSHSGEVLSLVAHELKNPLSSIRGYTDLLLSNAVGDLNPQQRQFLITIQANITRMSELIADLSDVSLVDSNRLKLEPATFSISTLVDEVTQLLLPQLDEKNLLFCTDIDKNLPEIHTDKRRISQILINLIGNAAKYTLPGGKIDFVIKKVTVNKGKFIQFSVKDSGIGIKETDKQWIFQQYFRAEDAQSRDIPGTGLGLYITKRLTELLGGKIWFESEFNQGSTFYFTIPAEFN